MHQNGHGAAPILNSKYQLSCHIGVPFNPLFHWAATINCADFLHRREVIAMHRAFHFLGTKVGTILLVI
jgi:hypothetical protein